VWSSECDIGWGVFSVVVILKDVDKAHVDTDFCHTGDVGAEGLVEVNVLDMWECTAKMMPDCATTECFIKLSCLICAMSEFWPTSSASQCLQPFNTNPQDLNGLWRVREVIRSWYRLSFTGVWPRKGLWPSGVGGY
jgi:hypothetical protein